MLNKDEFTYVKGHVIFNLINNGLVQDTIFLTNYISLLIRETIIALI